MLWIVVCGTPLNARIETWYVEVKATRAAVLTQSEQVMVDTIRDARAVYLVVRSVDDVERLLRR